MRAATAAGSERYTEWLAAASVAVVPARSAIDCCAGGGIIRPSVATRYQPRFSPPGGLGDRAAERLDTPRDL